MIPASVRTYLAEPAVADAPRRNWRDWALVAAASIWAILEAALRTDDEWTTFTSGWQIAAVVVFFVTVPVAILYRRTHPLGATIWGFAPIMAFGVAAAIFDDAYGGLTATAVVLVVPYALYRWGSGRDGAVGAGVLVAAGIIGNLPDPSTNIGDWVGGFIVLSIPVQAGLIVRYQRSARTRQIEEAKSREREQLARELHDTVAHHVSAIAVQAQAGQALAVSDPERALEVLSVIEDAASATLLEMRAMVGSLRAGAEADLTPQRGVHDIALLASDVPGALRVDVDLAGFAGGLSPAVDAAVYRIAQESITNSVRHGRRATGVEVRIESDEAHVRVTVTDDGQGGDIAPGQGYGLLGMAERTHLLGGQFDAGPASSGGWRVTAEFPREAVAP